MASKSYLALVGDNTEFKSLRRLLIILAGLKMMKYWKNDDFHQMSFKIAEEFEFHIIKVRVLANWVQQDSNTNKVHTVLSNLNTKII